MKIQANRAFKLDQQLKHLKRTVEASGLVMGKILYEIQEDRLYEVLGYDTFEQYLADPELSFKRSTAYNLKKIYKQWVLEYGYSIDELQDVGYDRLLKAGKMATKKTADEWLEKAKSLSRTDLEISTQEAKEGKEFMPRPRLQKCPICKKWKNLDEDLMCRGHK